MCKKCEKSCEINTEYFIFILIHYERLKEIPGYMRDDNAIQIMF